MPKTRENLSKVSQIRLTEEMHQCLNSLAIEDSRPMANMIRVLLDEAIYYRKIGIDQTIGKGIPFQTGD